MIKKYLKHPAVLLALTGGSCIVVQAFFYKRILHMELNGFLFVLPGLIFSVYGALTVSDSKKKAQKGLNPKYLRPLYWHSAIILATILSILIPYFNHS